MIKTTLHQNETVLPNSREIAALREHFPACFKKDGSFDIARFKELLCDKVHISNEGYELRFLGKKYARLLASMDTTTVITPDENHNEKPENAQSENIYISGDNLDGLKHLLKSYARHVKCIYIDPPYNTGQDGFVYNDSFNFTAEGLAEKLSIEDEEAERILELTRRGSASHSAWLMFMYPRLLLARDLLRKDGVIFISIDDNEQSNLKLICDDVFGEENFAGQIVWQTATDNNPTQVATEHEYVLCYVRSISNQDYWEIPSEKGKIIQKKYEELKAVHGDDFEVITRNLRKWIRQQVNGDDLSGVAHYSYVDEKGVFYPGNSANTKPGDYTFDIIHPITKRVCAKPDNGYRWPKQTFDNAARNGDVLWGEDENTIPKIKKRLDTATQQLKSYYYEDNRGTSAELNALFDGKKVFNNPKSVKYLKHLLKFTTKEDDIVLDFFGGSSTTAHAVMQLNAESNENRKFILAQWQEIPREGSEAAKAGFSAIDQLGMERVIRAANLIREENPLTASKLDLGFRHFTLTEPPQDTLDKLEEFDPNINTTYASDILTTFGKPTVLATWLVRDGYGFAAPMKEADFCGYKAHYIEKHLYLLDQNLSDAAIMEISERFETDGEFNPENIVLFGYSFTWTERESLETNLKRLKDTEKNLRINFDIRY
ncbi:MAG: site-specific DNA-methyltransferase [Defluviitaleaceae bacterium]|nr:site-specific DNA-methyltransferase [Defluviitaleaceae bacterium]MCL2263837.1 site-specific DNA-methyltransferase [Defluviitaleaceae bacterium]